MWVAQLVILWYREDGIILTKADKHSILLKTLVTCGIRNEAGQSSKTVDQNPSLQHSPELNMSVVEKVIRMTELKRHWDSIFCLILFEN